ncbi:uncharacterized mitochondrial protein AtMg00810-like [Ziziphus jujuba]|uniref:Uncharacterized mitochondrial protein AtMg00810-like n=1 Tax=Ziziphus jujuba TaxID=326968 RepID=A0ABM3ILU5_ZIZJJ|nr:uncharacterized mitochondrial protein AtMg00810-like [Ziziphus jujuba]
MLTISSLQVTTLKSLDQFVTKLNLMFSLKDLGPLHSFLGVQVHRSENGLNLSQPGYITDLLHRANMIDCKESHSPASSSTQLGSTVGNSFPDTFLYQSTVGALQYFTITRPEISFIVNKLSQSMHNPTDVYWSACKRMLCYLHGTKHLGLLIRPSRRLTLSGFTDADWASNLDDRKSISGYCIYLGTTLVSWSSRKQNVVARSSTEAEYRALALGAAEISWLQQLFMELNFSLPSIPILWCDNMGAECLAANHVFHNRTKYIEVDVHFVRDKVL